MKTLTGTRDSSVVERRQIVVQGVVQGVGFRPFVARVAEELGLSGLCGNDSVSVFIEAEGPATAVVELERRLWEEPPPLARVVRVSSRALTPTGDRGFTIVDSRQVDGTRTLVPPDTATCDECLAELTDPSDRRYRHPFITCTNCGPRFTIITDLPYDRPSTTMRDFALCEACRVEYETPADRRYHAQPVACHDCGPTLWAFGDGVRTDGADAALVRAHEVLAGGGIVAIKGIGGFHLACDAASDAAVALLRERKARPDKPFALMAPDLAAAARLIELDEAAIASLTGPARPIVLATTVPGAAGAGAPVSAGVAPAYDELGVMLPYAPIHTLLFAPVPGADVDPPRVLVMTSGNLSDEPLCFTNDDALDRLANIADLFLLHDRDIAVPCEDSVVTVVNGTEVPIRRSRGYAPLPVWLDSATPPILAVGGEIKNAFCVTRGDLAFLSAHLGDMGTLESRQAFERSVEQLEALHGVQPAVIVADDHPGYMTHQWADARGEAAGIPVVTVQHHHAHLASLLAEHGRLGTPTLGIVFDGTGYGCDKTIWGGELLVVGREPGVAERVGHLAPFLLPGGDAAVRNPFRCAMSLLHAAGLDETGLPIAEEISLVERDIVRQMLAADTGCVQTTSAGRLFDAVSSLIGVRHRVTYEAQAAVELEALARSATQAVRLDVEVRGGVIALDGLVHQLVTAVRSGAAQADIALGFHLALTDAVVRVATTLAAERGLETVGLSGGVFANRILSQAVVAGLAQNGLEVLTHRVVPCNDGGLALGQVAVARELVAGLNLSSGGN